MNCNPISSSIGIGKGRIREDREIHFLQFVGLGKKKDTFLQFVGLVKQQQFQLLIVKNRR